MAIEPSGTPGLIEIFLLTMVVVVLAVALFNRPA
jgi:hypothetical protein